MLSRGLTLSLILAIAFFASFDQGDAIKCRVCNSLTNADCGNDPTKVEPIVCTSSVKITKRSLENPSKPGPTTAPETNSTTTPKPDPVTTTPKPDPVTTTPKPGPVTTTPKPDPVTTTPKPGPVTTTPKPGPETTTPKPGPETTLKPDDGGDSKYACYKLSYKSKDDNVIERGCIEKENACDKLKAREGKSDAECNICEEDGCNSSSRISLGLISIFAPMALIVTLRW